MPNQAELPILKEKLEKLENAKRNNFAAIGLIFLVAGAILIRLLWVNMLSGVTFAILVILIIGLMVAAIGLADRYNAKQKSAVLMQIEQLSKNVATS